MFKIFKRSTHKKLDCGHDLDYTGVYYITKRGQSACVSCRNPEQMKGYPHSHWYHYPRQIKFRSSLWR